MANITNNSNNPDLLYLKSREDLLQYEDARMNSLLQAVADFYSTRNDQSIWGNFLRAIAIELAKYDYDYSYDIVNKDPSLLTPPDIRRRWASNLYVSGNWPSSTQFDVQYKQMLVQLLAAYKMGTTVAAIEAVIFAYTGLDIQVIELYKLIGNGVYDQSDRNAISVAINVGGTGTNPLSTVTSLIQLQTIIQSLYNAIDLAKPAHVGLEFTTIFGEGEDLDCILSPSIVTESQFLELPSDEQGYYSLTNYVPISPALFWKASTSFVPTNVLRDKNGNFQLLTSVGVFPNESGLTQPTWNLLSLENTTDGNLTWQNISPAVLSTSVLGNVVTVNLSYQVGLDPGDVVTLINLVNSPFLNGIPLTVATVTGASFTATFVHATYVTEIETTGTATFALPTPITAIQYTGLNATWQTLYQKQFTNTNCQASGITDTLRIFIQLSEQAPQGPMLIQAPVLSPANPKTTIAAYGKRLCPTLTPAQWLSLPSIFVNIQNGMSNGTNATYSYTPTTQFLHEGEILTITGFTNPELNVTAQVRDVINLAGIINASGVSSNVVTIYAPNVFASGMLVTFLGLTAASFLNGQSLIIQSASPTSFTVDFTHANYNKTGDTGTAEVSTFQILNTATVALEVPSTTANAGLVTPTLQSAYYLVNGQYILGLPPIATTGTGIGSSWVPAAMVFQGQIVVDSNGNTQVALNAGVSNTIKPSWNEALNGSTPDGSVVWRNAGADAYSASTTWVGVLNQNYEFDQDSAQSACTLGFTGEVGNWDPLHQYGLVAPRLNQVWEISGNPQDQDFIFGLY
jgi:hypothetical protein